MPLSGGCSARAKGTNASAARQAQHRAEWARSAVGSSHVADDIIFPPAKGRPFGAPASQDYTSRMKVLSKTFSHTTLGYSNAVPAACGELQNVHWRMALALPAWPDVAHAVDRGGGSSVETWSILPEL